MNRKITLVKQGRVISKKVITGCDSGRRKDTDL